MEATDFDDLLSRLKEIENLLQFPTVAGHIERANHLALSMARGTPGPIPNLAMLLTSAANRLRQGPADPDADDSVQKLISRLQMAIEQAMNPVGPPRY